MHINDSTVGKIFNRVLADLDSISWPKIDQNRQERWVTKHLVRPIVSKTLLEIGEKRLILSSDGENAPRQIIKYGMSFSPDLDITYLEQRCIAFEIKLLRDADASGSISKAIGQAIMYKELGYQNSLCLIIDCRSRKSTQLVEFAFSKEYAHSKVRMRCY